MGAGTRRTPLSDAVEHQRALRGYPAARGGALSTHAVEACVSQALPQSAPVHDASLAQRHIWGVAHGHRARGVLSGVLLAVDGAPLRGWRHESLLDSRANGLCAAGENDSRWSLAGGAHGHRVDGGGRLVAHGNPAMIAGCVMRSSQPISGLLPYIFRRISSRSLGFSVEMCRKCLGK